MRILLYPGAANWSYDFTALALQRELTQHEIAIAYSMADVVVESKRADLIVDFWWRGVLEKHFGERVVKQVSSHRWRQHRYGSLSAPMLAHRHLVGTAGVVVPSQKLHAVVSNGIEAIGSSVEVSVTPKGFDPTLFSFAERIGPLRVGWAGSGRQYDKRLSLLREAIPDLVEVGPETRGPHLDYLDMPAFYRSIDVITCASDDEGDPRTLIEGMACGCFPVTTDVGIARELIRTGDNGLIVEQSAEAFREATLWCARNPDYVRDAGRRNAEQMLATRTWAQCSRAWGAAFESAIARREAA